MMKSSNILLILLSSVLSLAHADDRDIYFSTDTSSTAETRPNILFVIDTSGSMNEKVNTADAYDNSLTYTGSYSNTKYYRSSSNSLTAINKANLLCSDITTVLDASGAYTGKYQYSNDKYYCNGTNKKYNTYSGTFYSANYLNWYYGTYLPNETTRLKIVKKSFEQTLNSLFDVNIGIMAFDKSGDAAGGYVVLPMSKVEDARADAIAKVNALSGKGGTPLSETLHEARLYFAGETPAYGLSYSDAAAISGGKYVTPLAQACQKNNVIFFTDGQPTNDSGKTTQIRTLFNTLTASKPTLTIPTDLNATCSDESADTSCLNELAFVMRNSDVSPLDGEQNITTYTIGGFMADDSGEAKLMRATATAGGGKYYAAGDNQELVKALNTIVLDILSTDTTFTAPAVSVNAFNSFTHRDELFYALFRPMENIRWPGNLKKYKLTTNGIVIGNGGTEGVIDNGTGFFTESAKDFWNDTNEPDGPKVELGGATNLITDPAARNIYYDKDDKNLDMLKNLDPDADYALLNLPQGSDLFDPVKNWALGKDAKDENGDGKTTDARYSIGDPLHSEPKILTYGGTQGTPVASIFFGDNEGYLHAIDSVSGKELFAFLPRELLPNQKIYFDNVGTISDKPYGMDGLISLLVNDANNNNVIAPEGVLEKDEYAYIYAGMRRGGKNYYALDVSNRTTPKLMFTIEGGKGEYAKLGQTWAKAIPAKVNWNGGVRDVLFIAGGYDDSRDATNTWAADTTGNAIYMADAKTGTRLWWASNSDAYLNIAHMVNSMPASVVPIDINGDGNTDYLFATDTGGRIFRIDVNQTNKGASDFATGTLFASLGADKTSSGQDGVANNRRFYTKPSVAFMRDRVLGDYLTISVGSGFRSSPRSTDVQDAFYVLRDRSPLRKPTTYPAPITHINGMDGDDTFINIGDADNQLNAVTDATKKSALRTKLSKAKGWYLPLNNSNGEKVIADAVTFSGAVIFNSFSKSGRTTSSCSVDSGYSKVYAIDMVYGSATMDLNGDGNVDLKDLSKELSHSGIAPRPVIIFREGGKKSIAIGTETIEDTRYDGNKNNDGDGKCEGPGCGDKSSGQNSALKMNYWRENVQ